MRRSPLTPGFSVLLFALIAPPLAAAIPLRIPADTAPTAVVGSAYSYQLPASGGSGSYTGFTCSPAPCPLPPGLTLSATGLISGTPTAGGSFQPTFTVTDSLSATANQAVHVEAFRPVVSGNWCPLGDMGGAFSAVAMSPAFGPVPTGNNSAVVGSKLGGAMRTTSAGASWTSIPFFDSLKVYALAADQVKTPVDFWAVTNRAPSGNAGGRIYHYDASTGNTTEEATQPTWMTGGKRHIRQAYLDGSGAMLASDDVAGILYRSAGAAGSWAQATSVGLPGLSITNIAFGSSANHTLAEALYSFGGTAAIYQDGALPTAGWSLCASLPNGAAQWDALAMAPDGLLVAGSQLGDVVYAAGCVTPTASPGFLDGGVAVKPAVNGFVIPSCYSAAAKSVYAYTDGGVFYTPNITTTAFSKISGGLLSDEVTDLGISNSCADTRMIAATRRHGVASAAANDQFCHARTPVVQGTDLTAIAATGQFLNPSQYACGAGQRIYFYPTLIAASRFSGVFRASGRIREMISAADLASTTAPFAGPEHAITDVATAYNGSAFYNGLFAATPSGIYNWDDNDENNINFTPTEESLLKIRGAPNTSNEAAYGISSGFLYGSNSVPLPWSKVANFSTLCTASALDLAGGGPTTATAGNDEMWIAYGACGVMEYQNGAATPLLRHTGGLSGSVQRVAATARVNQTNYVFAISQTGAASFALYRGLKNNAPVNSAVLFNTSFGGIGLPTSELANQIVVEPGASGATGYVWVLFPTLGLYRSTDAGVNFSALPAGILPAGYNPLQLVLSANFNGAIATQRDVTLLVAGKGLYVSNDGGSTWCYGPTPVSQAASTVKSVAVQKPNGTLVAADSDTFMIGTDDGVFLTKDHGAHFYSRTFCDQVATTLLYHIGDNAMIVGSSDGLYRSADGGQNWQWTSAGNVTALAQSDTGNPVVATLNGGAQQLVSTDGGATWSPATGPTDGAGVSFSKNTTIAAGATAPYWMVGTSSGAWYSSNGASWTAGNGTAGDYLLTNAGGSWLCARNIASSPSKVIAGNGSAGVYRTLDGGDSWRRVSGAGSGLEATSQNAAAMITSLTGFSNTDLLVGMVGSNNGGVYLSGDYGGHWMQINQGFDPNSLNISTLAVTSCTGCPVQYYSGTYGSGVYTRTIAVNNPPTITGWCTGAACGCAVAASNGPQIGGQSFKVCGTNLQNAAVVAFGGADSAACAMSGGGTVLTCSTPAHIAGVVPFNVRNPDTRPSLPASQNYTYNAAVSRVTNLFVTKSGINAALNWTCAACAANPAQVFRSQNAAFSLNVENFYGGIGSSYTDPNALANWTYKTYFWSVE
jgi:hypothetical protein